MNRIIKFRAWNNFSKEMMNDFCCYASLDNGILTAKGSSAGQFNLMQFTGLLDKNGKEIYEGDIIKWTRLYNPNHISVGKVIFKNGMFEADYGNLIFENFKDINTSNMIIEVIGNIYKNPELLKN